MLVYTTNKKPWSLKNKFIDQICTETCRQLKITKKLLFDISFVSEKKIREINKQHRNIDKSTDVISFALHDSKSLKTDLLGDIFVCKKIARNQARQLNQSYKKELTFLIVHGLLHLLGYDHIQKKDEEKMIELQKKIMDKIVLNRIA